MVDTLAPTVGRPKKYDDGTESTRLPKYLMRRFRIIASHLDMTVPDYIIKITEAQSAKDYAKARAEPMPAPKERKPD